MEKLTLSQIAAAVGSRCESKTEVLSICTDTRKIEPGSLFIAIQGENFDGNRFVGQAFWKKERWVRLQNIRSKAATM